jgi:hypothetical protein
MTTTTAVVMPAVITSSARSTRIRMHRAWSQFLRIAQERSETQPVFPLNLLKKALLAGLPKIAEGDTISPPCLLLPGELDLLEEVCYSRLNAKA